LYTSADNNNKPGMRDENSDRLWKKRNLFEILNNIFSKFLSPSEPVGVYEVVVGSKEGSLSDNTCPRNINVWHQSLENM
jgi:hypothetical protein